MLVELDDAVFKLVPGNFMIIWFSVGKAVEDHQRPVLVSSSSTQQPQIW